jgi:cellulose synthase/poly-beta-1,6-N-acetylglucosamine synthase-like glycosyltransferase
MSRANANIVTPGPLSIYRRSALEKIKGFSDKGFSEDVDIAVRLIRNGYKIAFTENAVSETNMPKTFKGFIKQRTRFAKGWINIFKKHLRINKTILDLYSLPLALFFYLQAVLISIVLISNIASGYVTYFYSKGIFFNQLVVSYFIDWLTLIGSIKWIINVVSGEIQLTFFTLLSLSSFLLTYMLYLVAIIKYESRLGFRHLIPLFLMTPYWLIIMVVYSFNIPELFKKVQTNIWEKNA